LQAANDDIDDEMTEITAPRRKLLPKGYRSEEIAKNQGITKSCVRATKKLKPPAYENIAASVEPPSRQRGRPKKSDAASVEPPSRQRGRPKKSDDQTKKCSDALVEHSSGVSAINDWDRIRENNMKRNLDFLKLLGIDHVRDEAVVGRKRKNYHLKKVKSSNSDASSDSSSEDSCSSEMSSLSNDSDDISYLEVTHADGNGKALFWDYVGKKFRDLSDGKWESWKIVAVAYSAMLNTYFWKYVPLEKQESVVAYDVEIAEYTPCEELLQDKETVQWLSDADDDDSASRNSKSNAFHKNGRQISMSVSIEEPKKKRGRPRKL